jgi:hypothetical protein
LRPSNFFVARPDYGPGHKRSAWAQIGTRNANRILKRSRKMVGQVRATGANTMLHGIGPVNWPNRRSVIPNPIPVGALMIPSETEIDDFDENLSYFAIFREWTPAMLWAMTHGPKVDKGWNMKLVQAQLDYLRDQLRKSPNSLAYQYMPERIEELIKQDKGYFGSDAVPTCDVWDFYFREAEDDGKGWYRRVILDWSAGEDISSWVQSGERPASKNKTEPEGDPQFIYSSGNRKYANSVNEIIHCQFGDCSAYAPFKYHSIRSLGWMLWGVCELQNRLHCKFNEGVFEQLMWFFQTASNQDMMRVKKANFEHMGLIPQGVRFLTPSERYTPNPNLIQMAFARNRQLMSDASTSYTQEMDRGMTGGRARTATETMAIVNATQSLSSGILEMAYTYEAYKYREMFRRLCVKNSSDPMAREFRLACLKEGLPEDMLDADRWSIEPERVMGGGNKTLQMATVNFLNQIRRNLPPNGQRIVDHISVEAATEQPDLAEEIAPLGQDKPITDSQHDAQLATERILRGFKFTPPKDAVFEDYVTVWMADLASMVGKAVKQQRGMANPQDLAGMVALSQHIAMFLKIMESPQKSPRAMMKAGTDAEKIRQFNKIFGQLTQHVKAMAQRLKQKMQKSAKAGGADAGAKLQEAKEMARIQGMIVQAQTKAKIAEQSAAARTRQKEEQFERAEKRKDMEAVSDLRRSGVQLRHEMMGERISNLAEAAANSAKPPEKEEKPD